MTDHRTVIECGQSAYLIDGAGQCPGCGLPADGPSHSPSASGVVLTDGGTFYCDDCGDETPVSKRRRYMHPGQSDVGPVQYDDLCPECSTGKPSERLFRAAADQEGESDA